MKYGILSVILSLSFLNPLSSQEYKLDFGGAVFISTVSADRVNVRSNPSLSSKILSQLNAGDRIVISGISKRPETIDGNIGYWLRIGIDTHRNIYTNNLGWIYGKYVAGLSRLKPSRISIISFQAGETSRTAIVKLLIEREKQSVEVNVGLHRQLTQSFYTFVWSDFKNGYSFEDVPGTYACYPDENRIVHVTYEGDSPLSLWTSFTDDLEYAIQEKSMSSGPQDIRIWKLETGLTIFKGQFWQDLNLVGHKIDIVYICDDLAIEQGQIDDETLSHARDFMKRNVQPEATMLIAVYRLDLDTNKRVFIRCQYIQPL